MGCCIAIAFVVAMVRKACFALLPGREPAPTGFAPMARRPAPGAVAAAAAPAVAPSRDVASSRGVASSRDVSASRAAVLPAVLLAFAATTAIFAAVVDLLSVVGVLESAAGHAGHASHAGHAWHGAAPGPARDAVLVAVAGLAAATGALAGRRRPPAPRGAVPGGALLLGAGLAWSLWGVLDLHVFALYDTRSAAVDLAFHGAGLAAVALGLPAVPLLAPALTTK